MFVKLFVLGMPGSGKSTVSRHIVDIVEQTFKDWSATRLCDYNILWDMFQTDTMHKYFHPIDHNGFYVKSSHTYDTALIELERNVQPLHNKDNELIIVEFARNAYFRAFKKFTHVFLQDSFFLCLDADIHICMRRVHDRIAHPNSIDDHFVSRYTFEAYKHYESTQYLSSLCSQLHFEYGIAHYKMKIVENNRTQQDFVEPVEHFIKDTIINCQATVLS